ncbi:MAG: helix-turn-helix domain-containing protein [Bacteroidetes bacterium]|nr:helix-turn-helix domain-containing protein [Bacteroidota bacterium]
MSEDIIHITSDALFKLVDEVVNRLKKENGIDDDPWVGTEETMRILKISSKTTLQKFRDEGKIRFSKTGPKHILYFRQSLYDFLEKHSKEII